MRVDNETQPLQRHTVKIKTYTLFQDTDVALKRHQANKADFLNADILYYPNKHFKQIN